MQPHSNFTRMPHAARLAMLLTTWLGCGGAGPTNAIQKDPARVAAAQSSAIAAPARSSAPQPTPVTAALATSQIAPSACTPPDHADDDAVVAENDLPYGALTRQSFDFARPRDSGAGTPSIVKRGIVVIVHGGGWTSGSKRLFRKTLSVLAEQGYAAGAMNYRLAATPASAFPIQAEDVRCGLHAIVNRAAANGHAPRVVLIGASAGGHLAMLAAAPNAAQLFDKPGCASAAQFAVGGVISYYAPLRLNSARARYIPIMNQAVDELLRAPDEASWQQRVATATIDRFLLSGYPAALLIHGEQDNIVPAEDSRWTTDKLVALGSDAALVTLPEARHGFTVLGGQAAVRPASCAAWAFVRAHADR